MLCLVGWKRLEANKMLSFGGVRLGNFNSIWRRSFVWKPKSRFLDEQYLNAHYPQHEVDGVFPKNPHLKQFLTSGPTVAAGLRMQHGFENEYSRSDCEHMIEEYASLGGDEWLTEDTMRLSCGLPLRDRRQPESERAGIIHDESQDVRTAHSDGLASVAEMIMQKCLADGKDSFTLGMFKYMTLPPDAPNLSKEQIWRNLVEYKFMVPVSVEKGKAKDCLRPWIEPKIAIGRVAKLSAPESTLPAFPELYNVEALNEYLHGHPARYTNAQLYIQYLASYLAQLKKKKGKKTNKEQADIDHIQSLHDKYSSAEASMAALADRLCAAASEKKSSQSVAASPAKRRRAVKSSEAQENPTLAVSVSYHYTLDTLIRTRRHADTPAAQTCSRRVLSHLLPDTIDLDISNCMFTIVLQLIQKLQVPIPQDLLDTLIQCAGDRAEVCDKFLRTDPETGKALLHSTMSGAGLTDKWASNEFLIQVQRLARYCRWLACSVIPEVYNHVKDVQKRKFPEASTFHFLWSAIEARNINTFSSSITRGYPQHTHPSPPHGFPTSPIFMWLPFENGYCCVV